MSELNFPKNPAVGQEYTFNSLLYMFDGVKWVTKGTGYNLVQDLYEMLASDAGASFVGANGHDNVQAALEDLSANVTSLEAVDADLQAQVNTKINADFVSRFDRESLRRSYAEAGYTLVAGSFEVGGTLASELDVLWYEATGVVYSGAGPFPQTVPAGTNPMTAGFTARDSSALRSDLLDGPVTTRNGRLALKEFVRPNSDFPGDPVAFLAHNLANNKSSTFSEGTYNFSTPIDLHNGGLGGEINGVSRDRSILHYTGSGEFITSLATDAQNVYWNSLNHIKLTGSGTGTAYRLNNAVYGHYEYLWIQNFAIGFQGRKAYGNKFSHMDIWDCTDTGLLLKGDNNNAMTFDGCQFNHCGKGVSLTGCSQVAFNGSILEKNTYGLYASGLNYKVSFIGGYTENNTTAFYVGGGSDLAVRDNLIKCSDGQTAFRPVNTNTISILELMIEGNHVRENNANNNITFMDLTDVEGSDIIRIRIKDNLLRTYYAGSTLTLFKSGGVSVNPNPKHIEYSDIPCLTVSTPTADAGTLTINTPLKFYPEEGGLMRLTGNVTINTTATLTGQNQCRITLPDVRYAAKTNQVIPIYTNSVDPANAVQGTITIRSDGKITFASAAAISGLQFEINVLYARLYSPA